MKTNRRRDPMSIVLAWTIIGSLTLLAACVSVISPLAYIWVMGLIGIVATLATTLTIAGAMLSDGGLGCLFAGDVVQIGFEIIGAILSGLAEASK